MHMVISDESLHTIKRTRNLPGVTFGTRGGHYSRVVLRDDDGPLGDVHAAHGVDENALELLVLHLLLVRKAEARSTLAPGRHNSTETPRLERWRYACV